MCSIIRANNINKEKKRRGYLLQVVGHQFIKQFLPVV